MVHLSGWNTDDSYFALIGAVGGSLANLLYPYFMQQKRWRGAQYRKLQHYDLAFGTLGLMLLNLSGGIGADVAQGNDRPDDAPKFLLCYNPVSRRH